MPTPTAVIIIITTIMTAEVLESTASALPEAHDERVRQVAFPSELMIWLSPVFPVGGFAYSQGLETAAERGLVTNREQLTAWLRALIGYGSLRNDLILLSLIRRAASDTEVRELCALAAALQPSAERFQEATVQGSAFRAAFEAGWQGAGASTFAVLEAAPVTLAAAVALAARHRGFDALATLDAYAISVLSNQISAAIRLSIVGQFAAQGCLAALMPDIRTASTAAVVANEDDLGSATFTADLACMQHETQTVRLFRS